MKSIKNKIFKIIQPADNSRIIRKMEFSYRHTNFN